MRIKINNIELELQEGLIRYDSNVDLLEVSEGAPRQRNDLPKRPRLLEFTQKPQKIKESDSAQKTVTRADLVQKILNLLRDHNPNPSYLNAISRVCLGTRSSKQNKLYLTTVLDELVEEGAVLVGPPSKAGQRGFVLP